MTSRGHAELVAVSLATSPGVAGRPNEDYAAVVGEFVLVLDGLTTRTDSGCNHGTPWFVEMLASGLIANKGEEDLRETLRKAIAVTVEAHALTCDLSSPATPAAAVGLLRLRNGTVETLVLGDITVVLQVSGGIKVMVDDRINRSARPERDFADSLDADSPEKPAALVRMKRAELRERNTSDGYWVAAAKAEAAQHSLVESVDGEAVERAALMTDGAARLVRPFDVHTWSGLFRILADSGPRGLVAATRRAEASDPRAERWPRNKPSDDATVALVEFVSPRRPA